jgi:hypothetical protein
MFGATIPGGCCTGPLVAFTSGGVGLGTCFTTEDVSNSTNQTERVCHTLLFDDVPDLGEDIK